MTLIIAEAGVNHNGSLEMAKQLIDVAASADVDLVKFQTFCADELVTVTAPKAEYTSRTTDITESHYSMIKKLELSHEMHLELISHCYKREIGFFSTAFDIKSIELLAELGLARFKVPSGEITNLPYLRKLGTYRKPVILSSGMATMQEIGAALHVLEKAGLDRELITVLHCNTEYPTPFGDVNLKAMLSIKDRFDVAVGYSDHTLGIEVPIAAVAMGATVIEKHFTLDRSLSGPDHRASLEPRELQDMVKSIRNIERALGDGYKCPSDSEIKNKNIARKSLVASREIRANELFSEHNLTAKRPGTGISPMRWDDILGLPAPRDFAPDELIEL